MVVFTCQKCNSILKKNAVEKHFSCRPFFLTCIDCLKDFKGKEYETHKSCITEAEKYGGTNFVAKAQGVKQEKWIDYVTEALKKLSSNNRYKNLCNAIISSPNIPRHKMKFNNYIKNAHPRLYDAAKVNEIFDNLVAEKDFVKKSSENNAANSDTKLEERDCNTSISEESFTAEGEEQKKKKKKDKDRNVTAGETFSKSIVVNGCSEKKKITKEDNLSSEHNDSNEIAEKNESFHLDESLNVDIQKRKKKKKDKEGNRSAADDSQINMSGISYKSADEKEEMNCPMELNNSVKTDDLSQKKKKKRKGKDSSLLVEEGVLSNEIVEEKEPTELFEIDDGLQKKKKRKKEKKCNISLQEGDAPDENVLEKETIDQDKSINTEDSIHKKKKKRKDKGKNPTEQESFSPAEDNKIENSTQESDSKKKDCNAKNYAIPLNEISKQDKFKTNNLYRRSRQSNCSKKQIISSLTFDQKTKFDCWFNIQKKSDLHKQNKENESIKETNQILSKEVEVCSLNETLNGIDANKLSKKERKLLKKQTKYAAEINEIEKCKAGEFNENSDLLDVRSKNQGEKKIQNEDISPNSNKRKHADAEDKKDAEKKMKLNETLQIEDSEHNAGKKFKWGMIIIEILQKSTYNSMTIKKLRKKVMNEYRAKKGDDIPYEKLLGIFNKKVNKTVGVKVLKDQVILCIDETIP